MATTILLAWIRSSITYLIFWTEGIINHGYDNLKFDRLIDMNIQTGGHDDNRMGLITKISGQINIINVI